MEGKEAPQPTNPFFSLDSDKRILSEYKKVGSQDKARRDAIQYAVEMVAYHTFELLFPSKYTDPEMDKEFKEMWQASIDGALVGDWAEMKKALQSRGRLAIEASAKRLGLSKHFGWEPEVQEQAAMESETEGSAFINLANSV